METINLAGEPGYEGLIYQFSRSMRDATESGGCDRLKSSASAAATSSILSISGLELTEGEIFWPEATGVSYNLLTTTNLVDGTWTTNQVNVTSPITMPMDENTGFSRIEVTE
jgi:hypothetical protein